MLRTKSSSAVEPARTSGSESPAWFPGTFAGSPPSSAPPSKQAGSGRSALSAESMPSFGG